MAFFNKNNIQLYESNFSDSYDYLYSWNERFNRERYFFEKLFKKYKTETILDCGSGNGFHVNLFLSFKGIKRVAGIEVSSLMIKKAMKNLNKADHEKVRFYKGDLTDVAKILKKADKFDMITCMYCISTALKGDAVITRVLKDLKKHLNKGGVLLIDDVNFDRIIEKELTSEVVTMDSDSYHFLQFRNFSIKVYKTLPFPILFTNGGKSKKTFIHIASKYLFAWLKNKHRAIRIYHQIKSNLVLDYIFVLSGFIRWINVQTYRESLWILKKEKLRKYLLQSGFTSFRFYSGYKFAAFNTNDFNMVVIAKV